MYILPKPMIHWPFKLFNILFLIKYDPELHWFKTCFRVFEKCLFPGQKSWVCSKDYLHQNHVGKQAMVLNSGLARLTFKASLHQTASPCLGVSDLEGLGWSEEGLQTPTSSQQCYFNNSHQKVSGKNAYFRALR